MKRRDFITIIPIAGFGAALIPYVGCSRYKKPPIEGFERHLLNISGYKTLNLAPDKQVPFNWPALGIAPGEKIRFTLKDEMPEGNMMLRVSIAQEIREAKLLHIRIPVKDIYLGALDIKFTSVLVPYELTIDRQHAILIKKYGLEAELESEKPLWIFSNKAADVSNEAFLPQIVVSENGVGNVAEYLKCFMSVSSVQAFGWREGTVLDGLWHLYSQKGKQKALDTINKHFDLFFDDEENLIYQDGHSVRKVNQIDGIESTIPFATLARLKPEHPILDNVIAGWEKLKKPNGMIIDGTMVSAEGCYTVAYPLAVIGKIRKDEKLMQEAIEQLKHRFWLFADNSLYLRYYTEGRYTYRNWSRGAAWTLLGFIRTIAELQGIIEDQEVNNKFKEGVDFAISMQREDGLWSCFMHDHSILPDTGGSSGIAAAILTGIRVGILPEDYRKYAEKCWDGLQPYISSDGFLRGVAQDNRAGEALQASDYRVIAQMGMGLMASLYAEL